MAVKKRKGTMKGHSISGGQKRPTKAGAGMTKKGVAKYRRDCLLYTSDAADE